LNVDRILDSQVFLPWIGGKYDEGGLSGKRLLVVGESHYGSGAVSADRGFTRDIISRYVAGKGGRTTVFYTKAARLLLRDRDADREARRDLWNRISFYNYVQSGQLKARGGIPANWSDYFSQLDGVIRALEPNLVLLLSKRLWSKLERRLAAEEFPFDVDCHGFCHPSGRFRYDTEIPKVEAVLGTVR